MQPLDPDARPQLSVLDRLFDDQPDEKREVPPNRFQAVRAYRAAVLRDLEWLLNSRANPEQATDEFPTLRDSSYSYGLPDLSSLRVSSEGDQTKLKQAIKSAIELHEPRLSNLAIEVGDDFTKTKLKLNFKVTALLNMSPEPEQVSFDTEFDVSRGSYQVKGG